MANNQSDHCPIFSCWVYLPPHFVGCGFPGVRRQEGSTGIHPWGVCGVAQVLGQIPDPGSHCLLIQLPTFPSSPCCPSACPGYVCASKACTYQPTQEGKTKFSLGFSGCCFGRWRGARQGRRVKETDRAKMKHNVP